VALQLKKLGFTRVRPLAGGFQAWVDARYPVDIVTFA
jgi:rhodanese-related sulfurtransferase